MKAKAIVRVGLKDLARSVNPEIYREAAARGMTPTAYLDRAVEADGYKGPLDAFDRCLQEAGIVPTTDMRNGVYASTLEDMHEAGEHVRMLIPELFSRMWRSVAYGQPDRSRAGGLFLSSDGLQGSSENQYAFSDMARWTSHVQAAIPLSEIVAVTTPVRGDAVKATYLTTNAADSRMVRVAEYAEVPPAKIVSGDHTINLKKYGRALLQSYESMRRLQIPKLRMILQRLAAQAEVDKVVAAADVLVNGDGNSGTSATNYNQSTLDATGGAAAAAAGEITLKAWLAFKRKFPNPYMLTTALMRDAIAGALELVNTGSANLHLLGGMGLDSAFGGLEPINPSLRQRVAYGWDANIVANKIVGFDKRFALEMFVEIGSDLTEIQKFAQNQYDAVIMTEVMGFGINDPSATVTMTTNA